MARKSLENVEVGAELGVLGSVSICLRLSREWSEKSRTALSSGNVGDARMFAFMSSAACECAEEIVRFTEKKVTDLLAYVHAR